MNSKMVILKAEISQKISRDESDAILKYYSDILSDLNKNNEEINFKIVFVPSEKYNISVLYPNIALSKKELIKILDEQNENVKTLNL